MRIPKEDGLLEEYREPFPLDDLLIQVCKPRKTGEQKIILSGESINPHGKNRRVVKFTPTRKRISSLRIVLQEVSPTEQLMFTRRINYRRRR